MDTRQRLIDFLHSQSYVPMKIERLQTFFDEPIEPFVQDLSSDGILVKGKYHDFFVSSKLGLKRAQISRVRTRNSFAKLLDETGEISIDNTDLKDALIDDYVLISPLKGTIQGIVFKVYRRGNNQLVGEFVSDRNNYVIPDDHQFTAKIIIPKEKTLSAVDGSKVVVVIDEYHPNHVVAHVQSVVGHRDDPGVDIQSLIIRHKVPVDFSPEIMAEVNMIPQEVVNEDLTNRKDYRNHLIFTIDGEDAKDFDDAVEISKLEEGIYRVGVHIADVSYYVRSNTLLDQSAQLRGTSIYLVDRVIPMLPHALSNGICSLNPNVDRLCLACIMDINQQGKVVHYDIFPTVIHSKARLTYTIVNKWLEQGKSILPEIDKALTQLAEVAEWIRNDRERRGGLDLDINEAKIKVNEAGKPIDIQLRTRGPGERLIEDFMVLANETVAQHVFWQTLPFMYRVHAQPPTKKVESLTTLITPLGYRLKGESNGIHPSQIQRLLKRSEGKIEHDVIAKLVLRSLAKAEYTTQNIGHFGLASECYTHFTSPIRRYPDLMVHRLLRRYTVTEDYLTEEEVYQLDLIADSSSRFERRAVDLERDVEDMKKAEYMSYHIGVVFDGVVSGFIPMGFFVELENTIEGLVRFASLTDDYYQFDEEEMVARGVGTKRQIHLGDRMQIQVKAASKASGQIDFTLVKTKYK